MKEKMDDIKILLSYLFGYLVVKIDGYYIERFINLCRGQKIALWNLKRKGEISLTIKVAKDDFKSICKIAKKLKCKVKIKNKKDCHFL